jgi:hypothetical protein
MFRGIAFVLFALVLAVQPAAARIGKDGPAEVRVAAACGAGGRATLRAKGGDDGIEVRFELGASRAGGLWRLALVHESRVVWRGTARTTRYRPAEVRRTLPDLPGTDVLTVRAWGPQGLTCRATATLRDA